MPASTRAPSNTPTSKSSPKPSDFLFPNAVPEALFPPPPVEKMETRQIYQAAWTIYTPPGWQKDLPHISTIAAAQDGSLWFSTVGGSVTMGVGTYHFDGKNWTHYKPENGLPFVEISSSMATPDGAIWFGTYCCGVSRFDGKSWASFTTENGLASNDIRSMAVDANGNLWFGTEDKGVSRFDGKNWQTYTTRDGLWGNFGVWFFLKPDGSLLINSTTGASSRITRFDRQHWVTYSDIGSNAVEMTAAPNGDFWYATVTEGAYRLSGGKLTHFTTIDGLTNNEIHHVVAARDGSIWFGTADGISRFDDNKTWTIYRLPGDAGNNWIDALAIAADGSVWAGYSGGIAHYSPAKTP
jgi:ligand-binding sensor domain-containing protein